MDVTLPNDLDAFVRQQVAEGRYDSPDEVVRESLRLLEERQRWRAEVQEKIAAGLKSIEEGRVHDGDEVFASILARIDELEAEARDRKR